MANRCLGDGRQQRKIIQDILVPLCYTPLDLLNAALSAGLLFEAEAIAVLVMVSASCLCLEE